MERPSFLKFAGSADAEASKKEGCFAVVSFPNRRGILARSKAKVKGFSQI